MAHRAAEGHGKHNFSLFRRHGIQGWVRDPSTPAWPEACIKEIASRELVVALGSAGVVQQLAIKAFGTTELSQKAEIACF
jgi:hypothetical protein